MRLAAIDIGTNSVLLLIVEQQTIHELKALEESATITRLGQGIDQSALLKGDAIKRTLATLAAYAKRIEQAGVKQTFAVGTSVLRDATNKDDFLIPATSILGCPIEVIAGKREAELVLSGVQSIFGELSPGTLIFDVGGGSTELILYQGPGQFILTSLNIGAVRFTERYLSQDPPTRDHLVTMKHQINSALSQLPTTYNDAKKLIGVAGTNTTLAAVYLQLTTYDPQQVNGLRLTRDQLTEQIARYQQLPLKKRKNIPGLHPQRADIILAGALIVDAILDHFQATQFQVCDRGVRWGLIWEKITAVF